MNTQTDAKHAYLQALDGRALPGSAYNWIGELRARARKRFEETGFPTTREEAWRYTNLAPLARLSFQPFSDGAVDVSAAQLQELTFTDLGAQRLVFVNGRFHAGLSSIAPAQAGISVGSLADVMEREPQRLEGYLGQIGAVDGSALAALNTAFLVDGAYVRIGAGTVLGAPLHLIYVATEDALAQPRTLVVAEAGSRATVIEQYIGVDEGRYFSNALSEIALATGAKIEHYRVQQQGVQGYHVGGLFVRQDQGSEFTSHAIDLGGLLVRSDTHTILGEGAVCTLNGLYLAGGRQHVDNHTLIEHAKPRGTSRELYKGVLDGRARAVFNGRVVVHPDAQQSDAQQTNNNLLLSEDAEVDTKPELEIYADDVKCSHGATVGQLDPDQMFYLRARALDEATARDLLTFAFANDVLQRFRLAPLRAALDRNLMSRLLQGRAIKEVELV